MVVNWCTQQATDHRLPGKPTKLTMEKDEEMQELMENMNNILAPKRPAETEPPKSMRVAVKRMKEIALHSDTSAQRLMNFANTKVEEKLLKIASSHVPEGILPEGYEGVIHDIKVSGHHADDKIYSNHADIQQKIPRGTTLLDLKKDGGKETTQDIVIYANRKFTGDIGDEDDQQPESNDQWKKYFLKDQKDAEQVVCMKKINGEAAHFSARMIGEQYYIIVGSKNVHMIIKEEKDIDKYVGDRFSVAKIVARCVWDTLHALLEKDYAFLLKFFCLTKCTAICELLQPENQHIMNLSNLKQPLLNVIGFTPPASDGNFSSLVAFPPHHTLDLLSCLGLTVPSYTTIEARDMQNYRNEIRQGKHGYHEEGEVLYFLSKDEETIGVVKTKTMWYIMLRALREKVVYAFQASRRRQQQNVDECISSCMRRFAELQEWLLFSDSYLEGWKKLGESFIRWIAEEIREEHMVVENIRPKYPEVWEKFLKVTDSTDHVEL